MIMVVAVQRSWLSKFSKNREPYSTPEEQVTVSNSYQLSELSEPDVTYTEIVDPKCQEAPSQLD